jgi:hypothetical protein
LTIVVRTKGNFTRAPKGKEAYKGARGMPRLSETTKDVVSCEKPWGGANDLRSMDVRMGKPGYLKSSRVKR